MTLKLVNIGRSPDLSLGPLRPLPDQDKQASLNVCLRLRQGGAEEETQETQEETKEDSCPRGWILSSSSCYYVSSQRASWDGARKDCRSRGAELVIINSPQEQNVLSGLVVAAWVGMTDRGAEGVWLWVDGTPVDRARLLWAPGQPDQAFEGEDCGDLRVMPSFTGLNDYDCDARSQWICEKNPEPV
ncbi:C-type lectin domain family 4 member M-like isoform X2 [Salarias fasciatus]|uniref:C-type lectin domain family 4 member M-like isoform X2 n=1 Tax=Salarias fasciatus TaxID=181472 RepID=UPI001176F491|nr:C-type lectin domain family 4 member M-like isoform X2 [Salarias fasciatus]